MAGNKARLGFEMLRRTARCCGEEENFSVQYRQTNPVDLRRVALFLMAAHDSPWHARSCQQAAAIVRGISRAA
jgi:hypothetical protein